MARFVALQCLGDVEGPRFLDGRTGDGTVGLAPSPDGFAGTMWTFAFVVDDTRTGSILQCLGDVAGPGYLDGRTGDGTVGLAADTDGASGTRWNLINIS